MKTFNESYDITEIERNLKIYCDEVRFFLAAQPSGIFSVENV